MRAYGTSHVSFTHLLHGWALWQGMVQIAGIAGGAVPACVVLGKPGAWEVAGQGQRGCIH